MKKAMVTKGFDGRADGEADVRKFKPGDEVHGDLAGVAVAEGWAEPLDSDFASSAPPPPAPTAKKSKKAEKAEKAPPAESES